MRSVETQMRGVGRVLFNPPSRMERRVKENPPYAGFTESID